MLQEEVELIRELSRLPDEQPHNDVWTLVRSRARRDALPLSLLRGMLSADLRKKVAAASAVAVLAAFGLYNLAPISPQPALAPTEQKVIVAVYSDDPLGGHTDAVIDSIDKM